jgi:hypothetical protein
VLVEVLLVPVDAEPVDDEVDAVVDGWVVVAEVPGIVFAVTRPRATTAPTELNAIPAVSRLSKRNAASRWRIFL